MADWDRYGDRYPPRSAPRPVTGGLKAKSKRGAIAQTWWSRRFIAVLERFGEGPRLARGRAYARRGQVLDLDVDPGAVTARVQGSRVRPYRVEIALAPLSDDDWRRAEDAICGRAVFLARLLSGEMPDEIEEAFAASSLSLFPAKRADLVTDCSCPDWTNPCKHIAAVYYLLAERFDEDPFLILAWRGRPRERLLAELRALRGSAAEHDAAVGAAATASWAALLAPSEPLDPDPARFWGVATPTLATPPPRPAATPDAILREVGPSGLVVAGRTVEEWLAPAYAAIVAAAARAYTLMDSDDPARSAEGA